MKPKQAAKAGVDLLMTVCLLLLMAFLLTGQKLHEWLGACGLLLFAVHHILNRRWLKNLGRGAYTPLRIFQTILAALVFLTVLGSMASGVMMSRYVFGFLSPRGGMAFARMLHMFCAYWGFVFLSAHLGLHMGIAAGLLRKAVGTKKGGAVYTFACRGLTCCIAGYGAYAFCKHRIAEYLFVQSMFVAFSDAQPAMQFFADYLAMMGLWMLCAYRIGRLLQKRTAARNRKGVGTSCIWPK